MEKLLLKPAEVSEMTGMGKSKTYELIATGVIPSVRIGKSVRVPADRLRRWVEALSRLGALPDDPPNGTGVKPTQGNPQRSA
jgi:excisionase family DNA binding protein